MDLSSLLNSIYLSVFHLPNLDLGSAPVICPDGQYADAAEMCVPCPVGTYKNNTETLVGPCTSCPVEFTTADEGSPTDKDCNVGEYKLHNVFSTLTLRLKQH